jgi:hypothetical protein
MQSINYMPAPPRSQNWPGMCLRSQLITRLRLLVHRTRQECVYAVNELQACASSFTGLARNVSTQSINYRSDTGTGTNNTYNYGTGTSMFRNEKVIG